MADSTEELEPLFDYKRVQPLNFVCIDDDDDDASPVNSPKRRKKISQNLKSNVKEDDDDLEVLEIVNSKKNDEEDWLLPPPKVLIDSVNQLGDNSTIKELRLKKQELESLAKSSVDVLRSVEESVKRKLNSSLNFSLEDIPEKPSKPLCQRPKLIITIQDKDDQKKFRVYKDDKFERLFKMYAEKVKLNFQSLVFSFDGDIISPTATPDSLGMEDDDIIEVNAKKS